MTRIYHLNCGSLNARLPRARAIVYCLLLETNQGLLLVDTGFGRRDYTNPSHLMRLFLGWMGVPKRLEETAVYQLQALGYDPADLRHIVMTHLHLDHAGGLRDFPWAQVHLLHTEYEAAMKPRGLLERAYDGSHWAHGPDWVTYGADEVDWYGFHSIRVGQDLQPEIRLVPLPGHTRGHCGVAIKTDDGWLLHCGDAASPLHPHSDLHQREQKQYAAAALPGWLVRRVLGPHVPRLRALLAQYGDEIEMISAHDLFSFQRYNQGAIRPSTG